MVKELLICMAKHLVKNPDQVEVTEVPTENGVTLKLRVATEDMGRVIGKGGKTAKAMRTVVNATATKEDCKVTVDIVE